MTISRYPERWCILWGGGLGDILVIRPLLQVLARSCLVPPVYATTATHLPSLFNSLGLRMHVVRLARTPWTAVSQMRSLGRFDWLYIGPRNTWKTRILAMSVLGARVWRSRRKSKIQFVADIIAEDANNLHPNEASSQPYGTLPIFPRPANAHSFMYPRFTTPYLVVHPSAKTQWQTKTWPTTHWQALLNHLALEGWKIHLVGTPEERIALDRLRSTLPQGTSLVHTELDYWQLEDILIHASGVLCHNSGIMHLALAHKKPTVVLTGSSGTQWRAEYPWVKNVTSGKCRMACNRYRCPLPGFRARCIRELGVEQALYISKKHFSREII